ncbi:phage tail tape measure protein [Herbaspirillum sp. WKF16]|uniref:phage tail tape measure protein n=1 Tax=Herbaspirillum sp. WKF16 TaxID=3028312 RepID=UPI0023AA07EC|nr:phage tail tape measure protein [Herbaspirillum sp. WKF16]WDZ97988.1 phage tail tape measure protein [Herbaspirillum sp. WKF16]
MFEAYKIGVKISIINAASFGLAALSKDFLRTEADAAKLEKRLQSIKKMALAGSLIAGVGTLGLSLFKAPLEAARQYELAFTKFKTMNLGDQVNRQADQFARSANVMGVSAKELMNTLSESVGLFGDFDIAKRLAPHIAALNKANSAIFGGKIDHIDEGATRSLMKFIDRRGGTHDEASFLRNLDLAQRLVTGSGGFVKFRDLDQFSQQGGTAFRGLSDQGVLNMALLLQEQGGARAGTAMMSMYQNLIAGRTTKTAMSEIAELGLGTIVQQNIGTTGGKPQTRNRLQLNEAFATMLQADPASALRQFVIPAIQNKHGKDVDNNTIIKVVNDLLSNRTASGQASIMTTQVVQLLRDANLAKNAMGAQQTIDQFKKDPNSRVADYLAKTQNLMVELGLVVLPGVNKALETLIPMLRAAADWIRENQTKAKLLIGGFIALSAAMAIGGTIMVAVAGLNALRLAISAIGTAAGGGAAGGAGGAAAALGMAGRARAGAISGLKLGGIVALADGALGAYQIASNDQLTAQQKARGYGGVAGGALGGMGGAALGGAIGALFGGVGAIPGAVIGGMLGNWLGGKAGEGAVGLFQKDLSGGGTQRPIQVETKINLDGRQLASVVSQYQAKEMARPTSGASFDFNRQLPQPGMNYTK